MITYADAEKIKTARMKTASSRLSRFTDPVKGTLCLLADLEYEIENITKELSDPDLTQLQTLQEVQRDLSRATQAVINLGGIL